MKELMNKYNKMKYDKFVGQKNEDLIYLDQSKLNMSFLFEIK